MAVNMFEIVKANQFFSRYAPEVKSYKQKCVGVDGRGKPITWTEADKKAIAKGKKDLLNFIKNAKP